MLPLRPRELVDGVNSLVHSYPLVRESIVHLQYMASTDKQDEVSKGTAVGEPQGSSSIPATKAPGEITSAPAGIGSDLTGQQESYHTPPVVEQVGDSSSGVSPAAAETAEAVPLPPGELDDDIAEFTMEDTFKEAMIAHTASLTAPIAWNEWQRVAKRVAEQYTAEMSDLRVQMKGNMTSYFAQIRTEVNTARFGEDYKVMIPGKELAREAPKALLDSS